MHTSRIPFY